MNSKLLKGLIITLVGALTPVFTTNPIVWGVVLVIGVCTAIQYFLKNLIPSLQSTSPQGTFDFINLASTFLMSLTSAFIAGATTYFVNGAIDLTLVWQTVVTVAGTYAGLTAMEGGTKPPPREPGK
jgi:hypothetical protein